MIDFKGHRIEKDIILTGVRWYLAYPLSYRNLKEMMAERGVEVGHDGHMLDIGVPSRRHPRAAQSVPRVLVIRLRSERVVRPTRNATRCRASPAPWPQ